MPKLSYDDYSILLDDVDEDATSVFAPGGRHATPLDDGCVWYDAEREDEE